MAGKKSNKKQKPKGWGLQIILIFAFLAAVLFMPTTIMLVIGMLPTVVAALVDRRGGARAITVGSLNLCGCVPFLLDLWMTEHTTAVALDLIKNPSTIIVMYSAAGIGYMIDWALSGIVASLIVQRSTARLAAIRKRQEELVTRWGREVTGELPLDAEGFPLDEGLPENKGQAAAQKGNA